jgi:hypothetical protein
VFVVEVVFTDEFGEWFSDLSETDQDSTHEAVAVLQDRGFALGFPRSSAIQGSAIALRELRIQSGGRPLRVFYAFDPARQAVLLIGGDKTGNKRFYEEMVRRCEKIWFAYLAETGQGG